VDLPSGDPLWYDISIVADEPRTFEGPGARVAGAVTSPQELGKPAGSGTRALPRRPGERWWHRQLHHYPSERRRLFYCGVVVVATVMLYYEFSVAGAVGPAIMNHYGMSFRFYVAVGVVSSLIGAVASLVAGLADRLGRAQFVAWGMVATALVTLFGLPNAPDRWSFLVLFSVLGLVEGCLLVVLSALVRDFSPQMGRASAMGFWTVGPVLGSLIVAEVSSHTLGHLRAWEDQFTICGVAGLVVAVFVAATVRELAPELREQLMVSLRDRSLIELRARRAGASLPAHPWRQMLRADVLGGALGISVFLLIYYAAVGFFVIYFTTVFGFSLQRANSLDNWLWAFEAGSLVVVGVASDRLGVRKPFMLAGGAGAIVVTLVFLSRATHPSTSFATLAVLVAALATCIGLVVAPWMAAFTETVEAHSPALTATGLAMWGWVSRLVIAVSTLLLPSVVSSTTPLVTYGQHVQALEARYAAQVATASAIRPATLRALSADPTDPAAVTAAISQVASVRHETTVRAAQDLVALAKVPAADRDFLVAHGAAVQAAAKASPIQWQHWFWVCLGGQVLFLPLMLVLKGRWRPKRAREDAARHEALVSRELARLDVGQLLGST